MARPGESLLRYDRRSGPVAGAVLVDSMATLAERLRDGFQLTLEDHHVIARSDSDDPDRPERVDVWIDGESGVIARAALTFGRGQADQLHQHLHEHLQSHTRPEGQPHGVGGHAHHVMELLARILHGEPATPDTEAPPVLIEFERIAAPELPPDWFLPATHVR